MMKRPTNSREPTTVHAIRVAGLLALSVAYASPSLAGMTKDLADCTASDRPTSAAACTRVMESGRLPKGQFYIGHYNRGWSHFNNGDTDKALADFDRAAKLNPGHADTDYSRAVIQNDRGEREKSLSDLDRYLKLKGKDWTARFNRALLFRRRGEPDRAFSELREAAPTKHDKHKAIVLRALILSDMGDQATARADAEEAIAAKPDDPQAHYASALISLREKQIDLAIADAQKAIALNDSFPAAHTLMGRIAEERGNSDTAAAHYKRAIASPAKSIDARSAREEARERLQGLTKEASAKVVTSSPTSLDCRRFIPAASITIAIDCAE